MNVLIEYLGTKESGPVFTYGMAKGMMENGVNVYAIISNKIENKDKWISTFKTDQLYFIDATPKRKRIVTSSTKFLKDCLSIKSKFKGIQFDYVIRTFISPFDATIAKFVNYKHTANVCHDPIPHSSMNPRLVKNYQDQIRNSDDIIVLTRSFVSIIMETYGKHAEQIHYMRHGLMSYSKSENLVANNNPVDGINYLFFGRIDGYKGLHVLATAYKILSEKYSNISLTIAGSGDFTAFKEEYDKLPNTTVVNRYIKDEEMEGLFCTGNTVVVLPYIDATQSGVIPIAFDYGIPVIASNTGGLNEQLFDGTIGVLFESGSGSDLAQKMESFLTDELFYAKETEKMREGKVKLQWNNVTTELIEQLENRK